MTPSGIKGNNPELWDKLLAFLDDKLQLGLLDNLKKIEGLDASSDTFQNDLAKYKEANAQRIKLMGYYLPALKQMEVLAHIEAKEVKSFSDMYDDE